jgi:hypothetical protein
MMTILKRVARWGLDRTGYSVQRKRPPAVPASCSRETFTLYGKTVSLSRPTVDLQKLLSFDQDRQPEVRDAFLALNDVYQRLQRSPFVYGRDHHVRDEEACRIVHGEFLGTGIRLREFACDAVEFQRFLDAALPVYRNRGYESGYGGLQGYFPQKAFEHWISAAYLGWAPDTVVLDLACELSPATDALAEYRPADFYRHDIQLTTDLARRTVSGFSNAIECPDAFCDFIMAHCAIDNFEGRADTDLFIEATRILKPGGRILITPLHMATTFENVVALGSPGVQIDDGAGLCVMPPGSLRFGRHYSAAALKQRVIDAAPGLSFEVVHVTGLPIARYAATATNRFMLVGTRPGSAPGNQNHG